MSLRRQPGLPKLFPDTHLQTNQNVKYISGENFVRICSTMKIRCIGGRKKEKSAGGRTAAPTGLL